MTTQSRLNLALLLLTLPLALISLAFVCAGRGGVR